MANEKVILLIEAKIQPQRGASRGPRPIPYLGAGGAGC